jgi:L-lactate dehydrogenase complex protein LldF
VRVGLGVWSFFARRPRLYGFATEIAARVLTFFGRARGRFGWLPFAGGWTRHREFPSPQGGTFQAQWKNRPR